MGKLLCRVFRPEQPKFIRRHVDQQVVSHHGLQRESWKAVDAEQPAVQWLIAAYNTAAVILDRDHVVAGVVPNDGG